MTITVPESTWRPLARELADDIGDVGKMHTAEWRAAVQDVPRHVFVPYYYTDDQDGRTRRWARHEPRDEDGVARWLELVYSRTTLVTQVADFADRGTQAAVSSSTKPDLMIRMLEALDVADGMRVLEIGTGTSYNAALLSHPLGAGNLLALSHVADDVMQGRFLPWWGCFMRRRATGGPTVGAPRPSRTSAPPTTRHSNTDPAQLDGGAHFPFLAQLHLPHGVFRSMWRSDDGETITELRAPDGSWCEVVREPDTAGRYRVREVGPTPLWARVETAWKEWADLGAPAWHEFGLTATPHEHTIWFGTPDGPSWLLPLPAAE